MMILYVDLPALQEITIGEGCFNCIHHDITLNGFPSLEKIIVMKNAFRNVNALSICDNEQLKSILIEDTNNDSSGISIYFIKKEK